MRMVYFQYVHFYWTYWIFNTVIDQLNITEAKKDVEPFLRHPDVLQAWSKELFYDAIRRIKIV